MVPSRFENVFSAPDSIPSPNIAGGNESIEDISTGDSTGVFDAPRKDNFGGINLIRLGLLAISAFGVDSLFVKFMLDKNGMVSLTHEKNIDVAKKEFCSSFHSIGFVISIIPFETLSRNDFAFLLTILGSTLLPITPSVKSESAAACPYILQTIGETHSGWM